MKTYTTACPRNCYSTCSLKVTIDEESGRISRIEANPANRATPKGACLKGLSYVERVTSENRIKTPLKKKKGKSKFEPISWEEAIDCIAEKLLYYKTHYGPQSVLYYSSSGTKGLLNGVGSAFWTMYGGYTTTYGDLCWPAGLEATRLTLGAIKHNVPWDLENARLIVLWGKNVAETNVQQMRAIDRAVEKGAKLIVIDPRRTLSADRAQMLVQPRPGSDGALALGIAHLLIKTGAVDHEFIRKHVLGYTQFHQMIQEYTPARVSEITDIPADNIYQLALEFSRGKPITLCAGFGMQRFTNSGQTMRAMISLLAITGNIGAPGASWQFADLQSYIFDSIPNPFSFYPPEKPDGIARVSISTACLGQGILSQKKPPIRMIWVERGNPVTQNPDTHSVLKAFRSLDFRVVVEQFFTDTALEADIILPAKSLFEQSDIIGAYWHPYIQLRQKIMEPPGQVKPETEIYRLLALRMGFDREQIARNIPGPQDADIDAYLEKKLAPFPELSLDRLREGPVIAPGTEEVVFADRRFPTPSGKIELYSEEASQRWGLNPLPIYTEPVESVRAKISASEKYPLYLLTPNTKNRIHSQFNNLKLIRQFSPNPFLSINPEDAKNRHISHGDRVRIFNDRGNLEIEAQIDFSIKKGCVCITNGWWITEGGTVNFLSLGRETDMGFGAAFHDTLVQVEEVGDQS